MPVPDPPPPPLTIPTAMVAIQIPKGPFRTKNTTTIAKIVNYYAVVFLLRPPNLLRPGPFLERKNVCNSQENGIHTRCATIVNHPAVLKILRVVNLLRVVFLVRRGPLGNGCYSDFSEIDSASASVMYKTPYLHRPCNSNGPGTGIKSASASAV